MAEKGNNKLLIISLLIGLGGFAYYIITQRKTKVFNIYSVSKSTDGKLYLYLTTKTPQQIMSFVKKNKVGQAIKELSLKKNPKKSELQGKSFEVTGLSGLEGSYTAVQTLTHNTLPANTIIALKIDKSNVPTGYVSVSSGNKDRYYPQNMNDIGKIKFA